MQNRTNSGGAAALALREINLELGMPYAADAIKRLTFEVHNSKRMGCRVMKIIHGYGSTGKGGKIRLAARERLAFLQQKREIREFVPGEKFTIFEEPARRLLAACPALRNDRDLERSNNGVTFILL